MNTPECCQGLSVALEKPIRSPFSKMIILGWFDGPTYGVVQCAVCEAAYKFEMLMIDDGSYEYSSWDKGAEICIYGLSYLSPSLIERITNILARTQSPQWPEWFRSSYRDFPLRDAFLRADGQVYALLSEVIDIQFAIAVHMGDLLVEILRSSSVTSAIVADTTGDEWFSFLGYTKPAQN